MSSTSNATYLVCTLAVHLPNSIVTYIVQFVTFRRCASTGITRCLKLVYIGLLDEQHLQSNLLDTHTGQNFGVCSSQGMQAVLCHMLLLLALLNHLSNISSLKPMIVNNAFIDHFMGSVTDAWQASVANIAKVP